MVSFFIIAALWPIATSFALPCADQPSVPGMTCHDFRQPNDEPGSILVHDKLRLQSLPDADPGAASTIAARDIDPGPKFHPLEEDRNECSDAMFAHGLAEWEAPQRGDCDAIRQWARDNKGMWLLDEEDEPAFPGTIILLQFNTCAFSVVMYPNGSQGMRIGNQDVGDLIQDSLSQLGDGNVTGRGATGCNNGTGDIGAVPSWFMVTPSTAAVANVEFYPS
ncbi:hypothetical protein F4821DRAFT_275786 [Hypoxylon rubiginosum]|uniref:Uncharacterized protein n=1 Tax=Hypoxylon rubiginosum TaxID=110542 RepID=A0ACC0DB88_9PEZI|nr:hypothetical protein F4821DRAFT_275786 [Hypoxylon rubiginosum]